MVPSYEDLPRDEKGRVQYPSVVIHLPENLDLGRLKRRFPPAFASFDDAKCLYLVGLLCYRVTYDRRWSKKPWKFIPLHSKELELQGVRNSADYFEWLEQCGVININHCYKNGESSKGYRLTKRYRFDSSRPSGITGWSIQKNVFKKALWKFHSRWWQIQHHEQPDVQDIVDHLTKFLNELDIDLEKAQNLNNEEFQMALESQTGRELQKAYNRHNRVVIALDKLKMKQHYPIIDQTGGRFHSLITNLPKEYRKYLSWKGHKLISIDIKNSQPFTLISIINNQQGGIMFAKREVMNYIYLVCNGMFYEYIRYKALDLRLIDRNVTREDIKGMCFAYLFSHPDYCSKDVKLIIKPVFQRYFPGIAMLLSNLKQNNYNELAIQMQRVESELVLNRVVRRISRECPWICLFTIHDSIATLPKWVDYVKSVLLEESQRLFGCVPQTSLEEWGLKQITSKGNMVNDSALYGRRHLN